jgi:hypothetical protein
MQYVVVYYFHIHVNLDKSADTNLERGIILGGGSFGYNPKFEGQDRMHGVFPRNHPLLKLISTRSIHYNLHSGLPKIKIYKF